ncbi:MAG: hypothetical protein ACK40X_10575 [Armatimonadota bacterium]
MDGTRDKGRGTRFGKLAVRHMGRLVVGNWSLVNWSFGELTVIEAYIPRPSPCVPRPRFDVGE